MLKVSALTWNHWRSINVSPGLLTFHVLAVFRDAVHYEERYFDDRSPYRADDGSLNRDKPGVAFVGAPRPEYEEAWANLMACK